MPSTACPFLSNMPTIPPKNFEKNLKQLNSDLMHCSCLDRLAHHPLLMTGFSFQFPLPIYFFSNHYIWTLHELVITTERSNYYFLFIITQNSESEDCCRWSHLQWGSWILFYRGAEMGSNCMVSLAKHARITLCTAFIRGRGDKLVLNSVRKGTKLFLDFSIPDWFLMFISFRYYLMISAVTLHRFSLMWDPQLCHWLQSHLILINEAENQLAIVKRRERCGDNTMLLFLCV